jgi:hypothetical protein
MLAKENSFGRKRRKQMDLKLRIEGKGEAVREFISFLKTDNRYCIYACARYVFSPDKSVVEFDFEQLAGGVPSGGDANNAARPRDN